MPSQPSVFRNHRTHFRCALTQRYCSNLRTKILLVTCANISCMVVIMRLDNNQLIWAQRNLARYRCTKYKNTYKNNCISFRKYTFESLASVSPFMMSQKNGEKSKGDEGALRQYLIICTTLIQNGGGGQFRHESVHGSCYIKIHSQTFHDN